MDANKQEALTLVSDRLKGISEIIWEAVKGGPGSGNWGHLGRPGQVGGSAPSTGNSSLSIEAKAILDRIYHTGNYEKPRVLTHYVGGEKVPPESTVQNVRRGGLQSSHGGWRDVSRFVPNRPEGIFFWGEEMSERPGFNRVQVNVSDLDIDYLYAFPAELSGAANHAATGKRMIPGAIEAMEAAEAIPFSEYDGQFAAEFIYTKDIPADVLKWRWRANDEKSLVESANIGQRSENSLIDESSPLPIKPKSMLADKLVNSIKSLACAVKQTAGANKYRRDIQGVVQSLWDGTITGPQFLRVLKYQLIPLAFEQAWMDGAREAAGISSFEELTDEERETLKAKITEEKKYVRGFRDYVAGHTKKDGYKLGSFKYRIELWVNRYMEVVHEAQVMAGGDKKYRWVWYPEAEHCRSCRKLHNQVRRMSFWKDHDCRPQHPDLECMKSAGGPTVCKCEFEETDEACSRGPLPSWRAG
jgi:hypothetical protein